MLGYYCRQKFVLTGPKCEMSIHSFKPKAKASAKLAEPSSKVQSQEKLDYSVNYFEDKKVPAESPFLLGEILLGGKCPFVRTK